VELDLLAGSQEGPDGAVQRLSLGPVRYEAAPVTAGEIERMAAVEKFTPNLCTNREVALRRIAGMRGGAEGAAP